MFTHRIILKPLKPGLPSIEAGVQLGFPAWPQRSCSATGVASAGRLAGSGGSGGSGPAGGNQGAGGMLRIQKHGQLCKGRSEYETFMEEQKQTRIGSVRNL